jgi:hypothetical protein
LSGGAWRVDVKDQVRVDAAHEEEVAHGVAADFVDELAHVVRSRALEIFISSPLFITVTIWCST